MRRRLLLAAVVAAVAAAPAGASAATPRLTVTLPGDAAAASVRADRATWIVGARPGRAADALAAAQGARRVGSGAYVVARGRARALARALREHGLLLYAEPNRLARRLQGPAPDPLDGRAAWRAAIVDPRLVPPPVTPQSPLLALVDSQLDPATPSSRAATSRPWAACRSLSAHGTETAAVAAAPKNDVGHPRRLAGHARAQCARCRRRSPAATPSAGIARAIAQGAAVINMSYGATGSSASPSTSSCRLATAKRHHARGGGGQRLTPATRCCTPPRCHTC